LQAIFQTVDGITAVIEIGEHAATVVRRAEPQIEIRQTLPGDLIQARIIREYEFSGTLGHMPFYREREGSEVRSLRIELHYAFRRIKELEQILSDHSVLAEGDD
jgi:hypothetical protein